MCYHANNLLRLIQFCPIFQSLPKWWINGPAHSNSNWLYKIHDTHTHQIQYEWKYSMDLKDTAVLCAAHTHTHTHAHDWQPFSTCQKETQVCVVLNAELTHTAVLSTAHTHTHRLRTHSEIGARLNNFNLLIRWKIWTALKSSEVYHSYKSSPTSSTRLLFLFSSSSCCRHFLLPSFFLSSYIFLSSSSLSPLALTSHFLHSFPSFSSSHPLFSFPPLLFFCPLLSSLLGLTLIDEAAFHWSSLIKWIVSHLALWLTCGLLWDPACSLHYREKRRDICYCCYYTAM